MVQITCWGARGSIAVCGPEYIRYGGETTCLEVRTGSGDIIILDAGTGIRRLGHHLAAQGKVEATLLFTHAHWDHITGFPFFSPVHDETTTLDVACCAFKPDFVSRLLEYTMAAPYFPLPLAKVKARIGYPDLCRPRFRLGGITVETIPLSHPNGGVGYKLTEGGRSFVFITDNQLGYRHPNGVDREAYLRFCQGADFLVHDAEYTPEEYQRYLRYGHSSYLDALDLALEAGVDRFALHHHNQLRTDQEVDEMVEDCRRRVSRAGSSLEVMAMAVGLTVEV
jgi:phosphoribosyl 1,2-cyclic phosphodiesterase